MDQTLNTTTPNVIHFPGHTPLLQREDFPLPTVASPAPGPIESRMRDVIAGLKGTKYPDQFDWSVYDKISARFGDQQPRGGVAFKSPFKLVNNHSSCTQCHYALELDTYGRGCSHNCSYCYAKELLIGYGYWNRPMPFPVDLAEVRKIFYLAFETARPSKWRSLLSQRIPIRIGCMSDSFMWMDAKYKVTLEMLKILRFYKYPYIVATRSDLAAHDDYIEVMDKDLASIQFSITGTNEELTRILEPGAPSLKRRLAAMKKLAESGFWTTARLNPLFPTFPDGYFTDSRSIQERFGSHSSAPRFNLFEIDRIDDFLGALKLNKVPTLMPGLVRLSPAAIKAISKSCGVDFAVFFKPSFCKAKDDRHYSDEEIAYYYKLIHDKCRKAEIRFTTCYIGNGEKDYYQYQDLWTNKKDCCDAVGNVSGFKTTSQAISWETRIKHAPCKENAISARQQAQEHEIRFRSVLEKYHPEKLQESFCPGLTKLPPLSEEQKKRAALDVEV